MVDEDPGRAVRSAGSAGSLAGSASPMSDRMQELLARAADEQLNEQRQVSAVLIELRQLVTGLAEQLRGTASSARLDLLGGEVMSLSADLRTSTASLRERFEGLGHRVDEQAAATTEIVTSNGSGTEALAVRVSALGGDLASQGEAIGRLADSLGTLSGSPDALAALRREVSGLRDQLAPLGEVASGLADLTARIDGVEALRPDVAAVSAKLDGLASVTDLTRTRDSLVSALGARLDRLEEAAARPVLSEEQLTTALAPVLARFDALASLRDDVIGLRVGVSGLQDDTRLPALVRGVAALHQDVGQLGERVAAVTVPSAEAVATAVQAQVTERLVDELAPRVADLVLSRVAATLVEQVSGSVTTNVQDGLTEKIRAAAADSERRISAHVDEAVLALAEALLRRRRRPTLASSSVVAELSLDDDVSVSALETRVAVSAAEPAEELASTDEELASPDEPVEELASSAPAAPTAPASAPGQKNLAAAPATSDGPPGADTAPTPTPTPTPTESASVGVRPADTSASVTTSAAPRLSGSSAPKPASGAAPAVESATEASGPGSDASRSSAPAFAAFTLLRTPPAGTLEAPTVETPTLEAPTLEVPTLEAPIVDPPTMEAPGPTPADGAEEAGEWYDDDDEHEDNLQRRPWWRPGG